MTVEEPERIEMSIVFPYSTTLYVHLFYCSTNGIGPLRPVSNSFISFPCRGSKQAKTALPRYHDAYMPPPLAGAAPL
jgi:hypothetical protein